MDDDPFWEVNLASISNSDIKELKKYHKESFDVQKIHSTAMELKYSKIISDIIRQELNDPSDDFARFFIRNFYTGIINKKVINQYKELIKQSLNQFFKTDISHYEKQYVEIEPELLFDSEPRLKEKSAEKVTLAKIKVTFPDGTFNVDQNVTNTYVKAINFMGADRISRLNILKHGLPFICDKKDIKHTRAVLPYGYVFTNLSTEDKFKVLKKLNDIFKTNLQIEMV